jgi:hypothetical protein
MTKLEPCLITELRMMIMIVMKKMNIHILVTRKEPALLTLDAGNEFLDEEEQWSDCLFLKVKLEKNDYIKVHVFDRLGKEESILTR